MGVLKIGVLGAGIAGLLSAEEAEKSFPTAEITIIANKFGMDTTSDGAAGLFMPILHKFKGPNEEITRKYMSDSYDYYRSFLNQNWGVTECDGFILSDSTKGACECHIMKSVLPFYRDATEDELMEFPGKWKYGSYVKTFVTTGRKFMPKCLERLKEADVRVIKKAVTNFKELEDDFDVIINCTGLGAAELCNDEYLIPIRGQVVKAKTPGINKFISAGDTYIIPNENGLSTLGGTYDFGSFDTSIKHLDTKGILERCSNLFPNLKNMQIFWEWVGLRPYRYNVRVEPEMIGKLKVIHNYGHGGSGISSSPGTAKYAMLLLEDMLKMSKL